MKKLLLLSTTLFLSLSATQKFEFKSYKDATGALDVRFLQMIRDVFHPDIFFETGTYMGQTTAQVAPFFKEIHTVELHDRLFAEAQAKLKRFKNVTVHHDKSQNAITRVVPNLDGTILFWLDAHFSGEGTATSSDDHKDPNAFTAIRYELQAIKDSGIKNSIILIDDVRGFGTQIGKQEFLGCWAYPTLQEVKRDLLEINPHYEVVLLGDILMAYDADLYQPEFSDAVLACTKTRFYDGSNLTDAELQNATQVIMHMPEHEKELIRFLYTSMTDYKDPMFWHDYWYGLTELGAGNFELARTALEKVKKMVRNDSGSFAYDHWLVDAYLQECNR